jgi:hypothetical protein
MSYHKHNKIGVFASLDSLANTTVTMAGIYYAINGTFSNSPTNSFSIIADPAIQYIDTKTRYFEIDWHSTVSANLNGTTVHIGIKKNGVFVDTSKMGTFLKTANESQSLSGTTVQFRAVARNIETPTADCIRRIGAYDFNNGFFMQFDGVTFGVASRKNGVDTVIENGNFNGNLGATIGTKVTIIYE